MLTLDYHRNADKGLVAGTDNAWFDSPIMSRKHAAFGIDTASQSIYIEDFNSTHGTFVSGRRLLSHEKVYLNDWEVVTFGVQITAGAETYSPRSFTFNVKWQDQDQSDDLFAESVTSKRGFHVPDEDDGYSSDSSISEADSVAILEVHPRTFSVPLSEDEDESDDGIAGESPTIQVPSKEPPKAASIAEKKQTYSELYELNGSSQKNPISLDVEEPQTSDDVVDLDSEDDGPEVLPISSLSDSVRKFVGGTTCRPWTNDVSSLAAQHSDDDDDDFLEELEDIDFPAVKPHKPAPHVEPKAAPTISPPFDSVIGVIDLVGDTDLTNLRKHQDIPSRRSPSPSDAALRRESSSDHMMYGAMNRFSTTSLPSRRMDYADMTASMANYHNPISAQKSAANNGDHVPNVQSPFYTDVHSPYYNLAPIRTPASRNFDSYITGCSMDFPQFKDYHSEYAYRGPYNEGPFSTMPSPPPAQSAGHPWNWAKGPAPNPSPRKHEDALLSKPSHNGSDRYFPKPATRKSSLAAVIYDKEPQNVTTTPGPYLADPPNTPNSYRKFYSPPETPARVHISDLVHTTPALHGQKRKAQDIEEESGEMLVASTSLPTPVESPASNGTQDAQPREELAVLPQSQDLEMVQDTYEPASLLLEIPAAPAANLEDEHIVKDVGPARKKIKTSSSKAAGVAKFVSGVAVGVVGVLATFIATMPASVCEEAIQELSNA